MGTQNLAFFVLVKYTLYCLCDNLCDEVIDVFFMQKECEPGLWLNPCLYSVTSCKTNFWAIAIWLLTFIHIQNNG